MTANGWLQVAIFFALIVVCTKPLGTFITTAAFLPAAFFPATWGWASTSGGNSSGRPVDSAVRRAICAFSAMRLVSPSACCDS